MKNKLVRVFSFIALLSIVLSLFAISSSAYSYVIADDLSIDGSLAVPFRITTLGNNINFTDSSMTYFVDDGFGSIPYDSSLGDYEWRNGYFGISSPYDYVTVVGGGSLVGDMYFFNRPKNVSFNSEAEWFYDTYYRFVCTPMTNTTFNAFKESDLDEASQYLSLYLSRPENHPFTLGYSLSYDGVVALSNLPLSNNINAYFPTYFRVCRYLTKGTISYNSNGSISSSVASIPDVPFLVTCAFDYATLSDDGSIVWESNYLSVPLTRGFGDVIGYYGFEDEAFNRIVNYYSDYDILNIGFSLNRVYDGIRNLVGSSGYIKNLSFNIIGAGNSDSAFDSNSLYSFVSVRGINNVAPLYEFSLGYTGASYDYHSVEGDFDNMHITNAVYLGDGFNLVTWLGDTLGDVLDVDIIGNEDVSISLGSVIYVCLGVGVLFAILKIFAGG